MKDLEKVISYDLEALTDRESKDWQYHFDLLEGNLEDYIATLKQANKKQAQIISDYGSECGNLRDKLSRRNSQIADLRGQNNKLLEIANHYRNKLIWKGEIENTGRGKQIKGYTVVSISQDLSLKALAEEVKKNN